MNDLKQWTIAIKNKEGSQLLPYPDVSWADARALKTNNKK